MKTYDVPYQLGTKVRIKNDSKKLIWKIFDHHGVSWPEGTDVDQVVLERIWNKNDRETYKSYETIQEHVSWNDIEKVK